VFARDIRWGLVGQAREHQAEQAASPRKRLSDFAAALASPHQSVRNGTSFGASGAIPCAGSLVPTRMPYTCGRSRRRIHGRLPHSGHESVARAGSRSGRFVT